eukprot:1107219-Prymnesium_polylepis.1
MKRQSSAPTNSREADASSPTPPRVLDTLLPGAAAAASSSSSASSGSSVSDQPSSSLAAGGAGAAGAAGAATACGVGAGGSTALRSASRISPWRSMSAERKRKRTRWSSALSRWAALPVPRGSAYASCSSVSRLRPTRAFHPRTPACKRATAWTLSRGDAGELGEAAGRAATDERGSAPVEPRKRLSISA